MPPHIRNLQRIEPVAPVTGYRSFGMTVTKRVQATCAEVECVAYLNGWHTTVLPDGEDLKLIDAACDGRVDGLKRAVTSAERLPDGFIRLWFEPGQPCFKASAHSVPWNFRFHHRNGDWRGNPDGPGAITVHPDGTSWRDEFGEHQQMIKDQRQQYGAE